MLPKKIQVDPSKEDLGITAEYLRRLQGLTPEDVGDQLHVGERAIQRRELEGSGLQRLIDIQDHFDALGYEMHLVFTRKETPNEQVLTIPRLPNRYAGARPRTFGGHGL